MPVDEVWRGRRRFLPSRRGHLPAPWAPTWRVKTPAGAILLRLEGFNLFNHGNILGRAQTTYGDAATVNPTFGQVVAVTNTQTNALPALANIDPPRMFQLQVRLQF